MQALKSSIVIAAVLAASFQAIPAYADRLDPERMCPRRPCLLPDLTKVNPCKAHPGSCK